MQDVNSKRPSRLLRFFTLLIGRRGASSKTSQDPEPPEAPTQLREVPVLAPVQAAKAQPPAGIMIDDYKDGEKVYRPCPLCKTAIDVYATRCVCGWKR